MKNKNKYLLGLVALTLVACGDQPIVEAEVVETKQSDKIKISDSNIYAGQVNALYKAKAVENLLLETSKQRLQAIDGLD